MAKLINGNGNPAVYAAEDADLIASIMGDKTSICNLGSKFAATASGANVIEVADGVIITKEGRRIQLDSGSVDEFSIPAGTVGTTNYYIIGYKLYENAQVQQVCETFVQLMPNSTDVIQEDTFKGGATEVYVSLYRVEQDGVNLGSITGLLPEIGNISEINENLSGLSFRINNSKLEVSADGGTTWMKVGGGMKAIYKGKTALPNGDSVVSSITLPNTINPSKCFVILNAISQGSNKALVMLDELSSTTLKIKTSSNYTSSYADAVSWQVVEFD